MRGKIPGRLGGLRKKDLPRVERELLLSVVQALLRSYSDTVHGIASPLNDDEAADLAAGAEALEQLGRHVRPSQALLELKEDDDDAEAP